MSDGMKLILCIIIFVGLVLILADIIKNKFFNKDMH